MMRADRVELLAPAGNARIFYTALRFGADAVYCGFGHHHLRAKAGGFTRIELEKCIQEAHRLGVRVYLTLNAVPFDEDMQGMLKEAEDAAIIGADALIVSDPGLANLIHKALPEMELHVSTQANLTNAASALLWYELGATRAVMSRELTLQQIKAVSKKLEGKMETEVFIHGSMCMAWSGRCFLSKMMTGRSANKGMCTQPCRWSYEVHETGKPGNRMIIEEGLHETELFSANDLCMLGHLREIERAGIKCLKVEGRTKSEYYVGTTIGAYRRMLDAIERADEDLENEVYRTCRTELDKISHHPYDTGFFFSDKSESMPEPRLSDEKEYVAYVLSAERENALLEVKNRFCVGDVLESVTPAGSKEMIVEQIRLEDGTQVSSISKPSCRVRILNTVGLEAGDMLRGVLRNRMIP